MMRSRLCLCVWKSTISMKRKLSVRRHNVECKSLMTKHKHSNLPNFKCKRSSWSVSKTPFQWVKTNTFTKQYNNATKSFQSNCKTNGSKTFTSKKCYPFWLTKTKSKDKSFKLSLMNTIKRSNSLKWCKPKIEPSKLRMMNSKRISFTTRISFTWPIITTKIFKANCKKQMPEFYTYRPNGKKGKKFTTKNYKILSRSWRVSWQILSVTLFKMKFINCLSSGLIPKMYLLLKIAIVSVITIITLETEGTKLNPNSNHKLILHLDSIISSKQP